MKYIFFIFECLFLCTVSLQKARSHPHPNLTKNWSWNFDEAMLHILDPDINPNASFVLSDSNNQPYIQLEITQPSKRQVQITIQINKQGEKKRDPLILTIPYHKRNIDNLEEIGLMVLKGMAKLHNKDYIKNLTPFFEQNIKSIHNPKDPIKNTNQKAKKPLAERLAEHAAFFNQFNPEEGQDLNVRFPGFNNLSNSYSSNSIRPRLTFKEGSKPYLNPIYPFNPSLFFNYPDEIFNVLLYYMTKPPSDSVTPDNPINNKTLEVTEIHLNIPGHKALPHNGKSVNQPEENNKNTFSLPVENPLNIEACLKAIAVNNCQFCLYNELHLYYLNGFAIWDGNNTITIYHLNRANPALE